MQSRWRVLSFVLLTGACVSEGTNDNNGGEGQLCFADGTCKTPFVCVVNRCVRGGDGGTSSMDGSMDGSSDGIAPKDAIDETPPRLGCDGGMCVPYLVSDDFVAAGEVLPIGGRVYFSTSGVVASCPKTGCNLNNPVQTLATLSTVYDIASDGTTMFMASYAMGGGLYSCPLSGCSGSPTPLHTNQNLPNLVVTDGTSVFWHVYGDIWSCPVSNCASGGKIGSAVTLTGLALGSQSQSLYFGSSYANIMSCGKANCSSPVSLIGGLNQPDAFVEVGNEIYFVLGAQQMPNAGSLAKCTRNGNNCTNLMTLATGLSNPISIQVDGARVYIVEQGTAANSFNDARISYCATSGCGSMPTVLVSGGPAIKDANYDANYVFFNRSTGKVYGLAKP